MNIDNFVKLAAIKAFYESGNDFVEIFANFVLQVLSKNPISIQLIQGKVKNEFGIEIPFDVLKTIIKRLRRREYLVYNGFNSIWLNDRGQSRKENNENEIENKQRENVALIENLQQFVNNKSSNYINIEAIKKELYSFIQNNSFVATFLLAGEHTGLERNREIENYIAEYLIKTEKSDPLNFERLKSIVYGKIISSILSRKNFEKETKFKKFDIYLDTNMVFSLMGLHEESFNRTAKELVEIIKKFNFELKIFSFTKEEIEYKLKSYLWEFDFYTKEIEVDSIYFKLKQKNFSKQDIILFIEKIEKELEKLGILNVDYSFDPSDLLKGKEDNILNFKEYRTKKDKSPYSLEHDVSAIEAIKKLRNNKKFNLIEKSKAIFLTADIGLYKYNLFEYGHQDQTIPEVIFRSDLASILWLKYPEICSNLPIHNLIATSIKKSLINKNLWNKFISELKKQKSCGSIDDDDINILISSNETKNVLSEIQSGKKNEDDIDLFIDEEIKKQKEKNRDMIKKNVDLRKENYCLKKNLQKLEHDKMEEIGKKSKMIESQCRKNIKFYTNVIIFFFCILTFIIIVYSIKKFGLENSYFYASIFFTVTPFLFFYYSLFKRKDIRHMKFLINFIKDIENKYIAKCIRKEKI